MTDWREDEARNEADFRNLNEWTEQDNDLRRTNDRTRNTYLCECGDLRCAEPIDLTRSEYEEIRSESTRFVIALNHENPEIDRVISENDRFAIVQKFQGASVRIARDTDPRRPRTP